MRIAIIAEVFLPKVDGVVGRTVNLIRHLQEQGDEVLVLCPRHEGRAQSPAPLCQFRSFPFPAYPEYRVGVPDLRLIQALREFQPDLLHFINPFAFGFRCSDLVRSAGLDIPTVFSFHTLYGEFVKKYPFMKPLSKTLWWLMRDYHNRADRNLTVSSIMRDDLRRLGFERVELWPPAVDCALFHPARRSVEMRNRLSGGRPDRPLLLTVSRLAPEKNVEFLADVIRRFPQAQLAIVGDGPYRPTLEQKFAGSATTFLGYLKGEELAAAYASSDLFVYASETETMGNVVLEAMASGLPAVAPRAGGIPSLVVDGRDARLFTPGDADSACAAVDELLHDMERRKAMGDAARVSVEHCGWASSVECVREQYRETIAQFALEATTRSRSSRIAPALVQTLVLTFKTLAFMRAARWPHRQGIPVELPVESNESLLQSQRGRNGNRSESLRT